MSKSLYEMACGMLLPHPDPRKGRSVREWAEEWEITSAGAKIRKFVKAGLMVRDKDWRPHAGAMRRVDVFRWSDKVTRRAKSEA